MARSSYGVLIVHGFTSSLDCVSCLRPPIEALGLPTRMPILRGHGAESPQALCRVTWREWVADARGALEDLLGEVDRAILFGHSMGGLVALTLAADCPDVVDSVIAAAAAVQLTSPFAPGRQFHFLAPLVALFRGKVDMSPVYADPALVQYDTNYAWAPGDTCLSLFEFAKVTRRRLPEVRVPALIMQSRSDTTVAPVSADIIYETISTPPDQKRIVWFDVTEHEMFRDCERESTIQTVVDYVRERAADRVVGVTEHGWKRF